MAGYAHEPGMVNDMRKSMQKSASITGKWAMLHKHRQGEKCTPETECERIEPDPNWPPGVTKVLV